MFPLTGSFSIHIEGGKAAIPKGLMDGDKPGMAAFFNGSALVKYMPPYRDKVNEIAVVFWLI